ncbi:MAG: hypothetical protein LBK59_09725 [Bifidobacteriaceae bacterium]|jgi:hypothetical protein|nr:hypothetical protein [Bifidobacteriaceae bacterium]
MLAHLSKPHGLRRSATSAASVRRAASRCTLGAGAALVAVALAVTAAATPATADESEPIVQTITVLDAAGVPVAGYGLAICPDVDWNPWYNCTSEDLKRVTTDADGVARFVAKDQDDVERWRIGGQDPTTAPWPAALADWTIEGTARSWTPRRTPALILRSAESLAVRQALTVTIPGAKPGKRVSLGLEKYLADGHFDERMPWGGAPWDDAAARAWRQWATLDANLRATFTVLPGKTYQVYYDGDPVNGPQNLEAVSPPDAPDAAITLRTLTKSATLTGKVVVKGGSPKGGIATLAGVCRDDYHLWDDDPQGVVATCEPGRSVKLGADGSYSFAGLPPGAESVYTVIATVPGYRQGWLGERDGGESMWQTLPDSGFSTVSTKAAKVRAEAITVQRKSASVVGTLTGMGASARSVEAITGTWPNQVGAAIVGNRFIVSGLDPGMVALRASGKGRCGHAIATLAKNATATVTIKGAVCDQGKDVGAVDAAISGRFAVGRKLSVTVRGVEGAAGVGSVKRQVVWSDGARILKRGSTLTLTTAMAGTRVSAMVVSTAKRAAPRFAFAARSRTKVSATSQ